MDNDDNDGLLNMLRHVAMQYRNLFRVILVTLIVILIPTNSCEKNFQTYSFSEGSIQYSFQVPSRYAIHNTVDIITFLETIRSEIPGLSDEQKKFYENCPDFPEILISTYLKPKNFNSREEVEEYNQQQSEKYGFEFNLAYDYVMLADFVINQNKLYATNYAILSRDTLDASGKEVIQIVSSYSYQDETNNFRSDIVDYEGFFEYKSMMWNVSLVAPLFMEGIAKQDFEHIIKTFKILD